MQIDSFVLLTFHSFIIQACPPNVSRAHLSNPSKFKGSHSLTLPVRSHRSSAHSPSPFPFTPQRPSPVLQAVVKPRSSPSWEVSIRLNPLYARIVPERILLPQLILHLLPFRTSSPTTKQQSPSPPNLRPSSPPLFAQTLPTPYPPRIWRRQTQYSTRRSWLDWETSSPRFPMDSRRESVKEAWN